MKKRILCAMLALCLLLSALPVPGAVLAAETDGGQLTETITWSLSDNTLTISGTGAMPDYYTYGDAPWYDYLYSITHVVVSDGVEHIGGFAFSRLWYVTDVKLGKTVTSIGESAFYECSRLTSITLPASVREVHPDAFLYAGLQEFRVAKDNPFFCAIDGVLLSKDGTTLYAFPAEYPEKAYVIPDHVTYLEDHSFSCIETLEYLCIPATVEALGWGVFPDLYQFDTIGPMGSGCQLEYGWETAIPDRAFYQLDAREFYVPATITSIGMDAFPYADTLYYELGITDWLNIDGYDEAEIIGTYYFNRTTPHPLEDWVIETTAPSEPPETKPTEPEEEEEELLDFPQMIPDQVMEVFVDPDRGAVLLQFTPEHTERYRLTTRMDNIYHELFVAVMEISGDPLVSGGSTEEDLNFMLEVTLYAGETYVIGATFLNAKYYDCPIYLMLQPIHDYRWETVEPAGCTTEGLERGVCTICGQEEKRVISSAHDFVQGICRDCGTDCVAEGDFGKGLHWSLSAEGVMTISGEGKMPAFNRYDNGYYYYPITDETQIPPWSDYCQQIRSLVVEEGITYMSPLAFWCCRNLEQVSLPSTLIGFHISCFWDCTALTELVFPASLEHFSESRGTDCIYDTRFDSFRHLESIVFQGDCPDGYHVFSNCPEGLSIIARYSLPKWQTLLASSDFREYLPASHQFYELDQIMDPADFALSQRAYRISVGQSLQISHNADPYTKARLIQWTVADPSIVQLSADGCIMGMAAGTTTVSVQYADGRIIGSCQVTVEKATIPTSQRIQSPHTTAEQIGAHDYTNADSVTTSALTCNPDGTWDMVYAQDGTGVIIVRLDADWNLLWEKTVSAGDVIPPHQAIPLDTLLYGGCLMGSDYNFLLFGMQNPDENNKQEVLRLVRYDKDWNQLDHLAVYGANTRLPFVNGTVDFDEANGRLYIHTCHEMYTDENGSTPQGNMTLVVDQSTMRIVDQWSDVMNEDWGFASSSFSQKVRATEEYVFRVDHGNAHPRAILLTRADADGSLTDVVSTHVMEIAGASGNYRTGLSVGGFELSGENCLIVGNSIVQDFTYMDPAYNSLRNIFLCVTDQELRNTQTIWLTDYPASDSNLKVRTPQLVKLQEDAFLVMWEEDNYGDDLTAQTRMVLVSGNGALRSEIITLDCRLSDCQSVVTNDGYVTWYTSDETATWIYRLSWAQLVCQPEELELALGHQYEPTVTPPTCEYGGYTTYRCVWCNDSYADDETDPLGHTVGQWEIVYYPDCYEGGKVVRYCQRDCGYEEYGTLPQYYHDYIPIVVEPGCWSEGYTLYTCQHCLDQYEDDYTDPLGHDHSQWVVTREPGCTYSGTETSTCSRCNYSISRKIDPLGHQVEPMEEPPTCTEEGLITYKCTRCYAVDLGQGSETIPALGHDLQPVVIPATCTEGGYTELRCARCDELDSITDYTDPLGHDYQNGSCVRCDAIKPLVNPFTDVAEDQWYYDPVLWAVDEGITSGTSATTFSPDQTCTRAQVVTFLWRAMGKPEPASMENPFTDVASTDYFYEAVLWAVEQGITAGVGNGRFAPEDPCTRDQVVTFLWRAMGKPEPEENHNPFTDVTNDQWYYSPVLWAVEHGVTSGTSATTFSPAEPCTRAQVVTFLYRTLTQDET